MANVNGKMSFIYLLSLLLVARVYSFSSHTTSSMRISAVISPTPPKALPSPLRLRSPSLSISSRLNLSDKNNGDENIHSIGSNLDTTNTTTETATGDEESEKESKINEEEGLSLGMGSGWASFLPSWASSSQSQPAPSAPQDLENSDDNTTSLEEDLAAVETSVLSPNGTRGDRGDVIDVDIVEESNSNDTSVIKVVDTSAEIKSKKKTLTKKALQGITSVSLKGGKSLLKLGKKIRDRRNDEIASSNAESDQALSIDARYTILGNATERGAVSGNSTEGGSVSNSSSIMDSSDSNEEEVTGDTSRKRNRGRRRQPSDENDPAATIFTQLESKDIDTTTRSKQRKWERRRKRSLRLYKTTKISLCLFVFTFLAGNIMNQFVDLSEDGSFEVHFGKTSPSLSPTTTPKSEKTQLIPSTKKGLFHTITTPKQNYVGDGARAEAMGLVKFAVQRVGPAVVRVETETYLDADGGKGKVQSEKQLNNNINENGDLSNDGEDRGDIFDGIPEAPPPSDSGQNIDFGQGSGIIVNSEGYILTNAHVVEGATRVYVLLTDGRRFRAEMQGSDDIIDVAVLKIISEPDSIDKQMMTNLPVAQLGNSDQMEVGQFVTAIGSPGGLDNTCTIGIVSGLKRCPKVVGIPDKLGALDYIQTDAAINQGNSGGPLVDVESGNIVGINTCIRANMEGTSFAIPINKVMGIVDDLSEGKHISHGYLGVHMSTMNPTLARYYNKLQQSGRKIPEKEGVMIEKVFKNSPAKEGGLKKFDFVTEIGGQRVEKADDAHVVIDRATIGEELSIKVMRDDTEVTVQVKPEDLSPRLKQLREERTKRTKSKAKEDDMT